MRVEGESCKRFFRFSDFLFAEVGHHFLASREAKIEVSSSGGADISVEERLDVKLDGSGDVRYRGNPPKSSADVTSSGRLMRVD